MAGPFDGYYAAKKSAGTTTGASALPGGSPQAVQNPFAGYGEQKVQRTMDGDTLEGTSKGKTLASSFRFAGIDSPESAQTQGPAAQAFLDKLIEEGGGSVRVGSKHRDHHGRTVSTFYAGGKNLNVELVRAGHAKVYDAYLGQLSRPVQQALKDAQEEAKSKRLGVWGDGGDQEDPEAFRRAQEAKFGSKAGMLGHERRQRVDEGKVQSEAEFWAGYERSRRGGDRDPGALRLLGSGPGVTGSDGKVFHGERYVPEEGFLDHVLGGMDYLGNISRSFILGMGRGGLHKGMEYAAQAAEKERKTTPTLLKDTATQAAGLGKIRMGQDDGTFQVGDVGDFAADLVIDIFTDPVTAITAGFGKLASSGGKVGAAAAAAKLGETSKAAKAWNGAKAGVGGVIGGAYGYGAADADAPVAEKLAYAAGGAALGAAAGPAMEKMGSAVRKKFDDVYDWYAVKTRGTQIVDGKVQSVFAGHSGRRQIAKAAQEREAEIATWIQQGRLEALENLDEVGRLQATKIMESMKTKTIELRAARQKAEGIVDGSKEFNVMMREINDEVENYWLPKMYKNTTKDGGSSMAVRESVRKWTEHNERVMERFNREVHGIGEKITRDEADELGKGLVGIRFHVDDVYKKQDFDAAQVALATGQVHKAKSLKRAVREDLSLDQAYAVYTNDFAKKFLNDVELGAKNAVQAYGAQMPISKGLRRMEAGLKGFDRLTNFSKANMLYFSMSWLKNNYFDNLGKAWIENGVAGLVGAATTGGLRKRVSKDVASFLRGDVSLLYKADHFQDALKHGVLNGPMFKSMTDEVTRDFLFRPKEILEANDKTIANYAKKAHDLWFSKNPVIHLVGRVGSYMEGTARMMTFLNTFEQLKRSKALKGANDEALKRMAAKVVKDTFFDYGDVTAFESAVFKRIVPFYSFYSKNLPYWVKATFDPERAGRVLALEKVRHNIGKDPTAREKESMSPFLAESAPRSMGKNAHGEEQFLISPSQSMHDAVKMLDMRPSGILKLLVEKSNAIPKAVLELASGYDTFTDDKLYPSDLRGGKKFLYSRGFKWYAVKKAAEFLGQDADSLFQQAAGLSGVDVDKRGNPYTTKGWTVVIDKVASTLLPHGFVDQVAGSIGKVGMSKETIDEAIFNRLSPMMKVKVGAQQARMVRERKQQQKKAENP